MRQKIRDFPAAARQFSAGVRLFPREGAQHDLALGAAERVVCRVHFAQQKVSEPDQPERSHDEREVSGRAVHRHAAVVTDRRRDGLERQLLGEDDGVIPPRERRVAVVRVAHARDRDRSPLRGLLAPARDREQIALVLEGLEAADHLQHVEALTFQQQIDGVFADVVVTARPPVGVAEHRDAAALPDAVEGPLGGRYLKARDLVILFRDGFHIFRNCVPVRGFVSGREFVDALQPAFAAISATGIRYDELPGKQSEVKQAFETQVNPVWIEKRGLKIWSVSILSATVSDADMKRIQEFEDRAWNRDPGNAAATLVEAQAQAMQNAASNPNGAAMGLFGMGMAQQAGGMNAQSLFGMAQQNQMNQAQQPQASAGGAADSWKCECGETNTGKFCASCGKPKPVVLTPDGWTCDCGAVNKGRFCSNCGQKKPEGAPLYKCDKCGWEPEDPKNPPKFCPECGDPFTDDDIVK